MESLEVEEEVGLECQGGLCGVLATREGVFVDDSVNWLTSVQKEIGVELVLERHEGE